MEHGIDKDTPGPFRVVREKEGDSPTFPRMGCVHFQMSQVNAVRLGS